jgi:CheY-like chemotaxis protein
MMARILIVEDEPTNRYLLETALTHEGYEVAGAASGHEAMERVAAFDPDLILLDWMTPGPPGVETVKGLLDRATARIVVVSALAAGARGETIAASGCHDMMSKPYDLVDLLDRVRGWVEAGRP